MVNFDNIKAEMEYTRQQHEKLKEEMEHGQKLARDKLQTIMDNIYKVSEIESKPEPQVKEEEKMVAPKCAVDENVTNVGMTAAKIKAPARMNSWSALLWLVIGLTLGTVLDTVKVYKLGVDVKNAAGQVWQNTWETGVNVVKYIEARDSCRCPDCDCTKDGKSCTCKKDCKCRP